MTMLAPLPIELLTQIAREIKLSSSPLLAFSLSSRTFYHACLCLLFSDVHIRSNKSIKRFADRLREKQELAAYIKSLELSPAEPRKRGEIPITIWDRSKNLDFWYSIPELPNLKALTVAQDNNYTSVALVDISNLASRCKNLGQICLCGSVAVPGLTQYSWERPLPCDNPAILAARTIQLPKSLNSLTLDNFLFPRTFAALGNWDVLTGEFAELCMPFVEHLTIKNQPKHPQSILPVKAFKMVKTFSVETDPGNNGAMPQLDIIDTFPNLEEFCLRRTVYGVMYASVCSAIQGAPNINGFSIIRRYADVLLELYSYDDGAGKTTIPGIDVYSIHPPCPPVVEPGRILRATACRIGAAQCQIGGP